MGVFLRTLSLLRDIRFYRLALVFFLSVFFSQIVSVGGLGDFLREKASRPIAFNFREYLGKGSDLDANIKIYSYDNKAANYTGQETLALEEWIDLLVQKAAAKPKIIFIFKMFAFPGGRVDSERILEKLQSVQAPIVVGGFYTRRKLMFRDEMSLDRKQFKLTDIIPERGLRDNDELPWPIESDLYPYAAYSGIAAGLPYIGFWC